MLQEDELFAGEVKDRKEEHDHFRARFFARESPELQVALGFDAPEYFGDLFFQGNDLFLDRFRFKRVGLDGLKDLAERRPGSAAISRLFPG